MVSKKIKTKIKRETKTSTEDLRVDLKAIKRTKEINIKRLRSKTKKTKRISNVISRNLTREARIDNEVGLAERTRAKREEIDPY